MNLHIPLLKNHLTNVGETSKYFNFNMTWSKSYCHININSVTFIFQFYFQDSFLYFFICFIPSSIKTKRKIGFKKINPCFFEFTGILIICYKIIFVSYVNFLNYCSKIFSLEKNSKVCKLNKV